MISFNLPHDKEKFQKLIEFLEKVTPKGDLYGNIFWASDRRCTGGNMFEETLIIPQRFRKQAKLFPEELQVEPDRLRNRVYESAFLKLLLRDGPVDEGEWRSLAGTKQVLSCDLFVTYALLHAGYINFSDLSKACKSSKEKNDNGKEFHDSLGLKLGKEIDLESSEAIKTEYLGSLEKETVKVYFKQNKDGQVSHTGITVNGFSYSLGFNKSQFEGNGKPMVINYKEYLESLSMDKGSKEDHPPTLGGIRKKLTKMKKTLSRYEKSISKIGNEIRHLKKKHPNTSPAPIEEKSINKGDPSIKR